MTIRKKEKVEMWYINKKKEKESRWDEIVLTWT